MLYTTPTLPNELYHHGIKGQKWGVRRYQNEDGTWTEAGRKRYGSGKNRYKNQDGTYTEQGHKHYSEEGSKEYAKKVLITAGAVLGTAAAVYAAKEIGRNYFDETIKSGIILNNLADRPDRINHGMQWYSSFRSGDNDRYAAEYGRQGTENKIRTEIGVRENIKIAGKRSAEKEFKNLVKNDKEFRDTIQALAPQFRAALMANGGNPKYANSSDYEAFIGAAPLVAQQHPQLKENIRQLQKFYGQLKKKGYSGVHDTNDRKYSGFKTKANIMFDNSKLDATYKMHRLSDHEIQNAKRRNVRRRITDAMTSPTGALIGVGIGASAANKKYNNERAEYLRSENERKKKENNTR